MSKEMLIIVNPKSGKAKMRTELLDISEIFSSAGYHVSVYPTQERADATKKAEKLKTGDFDTVVVCGGDGTLNEVITGLMHSGTDVKLGYIPSGTLNEWSSGLGISRDIKTAAKDIVTGSVIELDIGKFGEKYFSYTASFGAFTEASYSAPQEIKNALGQAAYFFEGIKSLGNIKPIHLCFEHDDEKTEGDFLFGAVSNSMSVGGIVKFDEAVVKLNDGLFEVLLIRKPKNIIEFQNIIDGILRKDLTKNGIEFFHTSNLTVTQGEHVNWTLDGEYAEGSDPLSISNIHNAVKFIVPKTELKAANIK